MKTIKLLLPVMILTLIACEQKVVENKQEVEPETSLKSNPVTPSSLVTLAEAKEHIDFYNVAHPGVSGNEYALHLWISIEELENYIAYVKEESAKKNIKVSGIDFIQAQYKNAKPGLSNKLNTDYDLTLLYAPTFDDHGANVAFDPLSSTDGNPAKLKDIFKTVKTETSKIDSTTNAVDKSIDDLSGIGNRINACPNNCPTGQNP